MTHHKINYVEFPAKDLKATEQFFERVFDWRFVYYGPEYMSFQEAGLDGGFFHSTQTSIASKGSALVVLYSDALEKTLEQVQAAGGIITQEIFSFPGGRRFHFTEPSGNELAVWST